MAGTAWEVAREVLEEYGRREGELSPEQRKCARVLLREIVDAAKVSAPKAATCLGKVRTLARVVGMKADLLEELRGAPPSLTGERLSAGEQAADQPSPLAESYRQHIEAVRQLAGRLLAEGQEAEARAEGDGGNG